MPSNNAWNGRPTLFTWLVEDDDDPEEDSADEEVGGDKELRSSVVNTLSRYADLDGTSPRARAASRPSTA